MAASIEREDPSFQEADVLKCCWLSATVFLEPKTEAAAASLQRFLVSDVEAGCKLPKP